MAERHQDADQSEERTPVRNEAVVRGRRPFGRHFAQLVRMSLGIHPTASSLKIRLRTRGAGGRRCVSDFARIVAPHHPISNMTITVVTYMIFSASSEDSWMPLVLRHQK